jgi:iron complex outermembrane recepter protein
MMSLHKPAIRSAALVSACWVLGLSAPALAQTPVAATATDDGEIIVTANRREQRLVDVPLAVTALGGDTLTRQGLTQIENFVAKVPGFSIEQTGRTGLRLVLRGQNTGGAGASVATMIDDVVLNAATANSQGSTVTSNIDTFDLERIEVLRGPQGTLYGATAQGGLLKYVTRRPDLDTVGGAVEFGTESLRYGETGWSAKGAINVPILTDRIALRVSGFYRDVPGYIDNPLLGLKDVNGGEQYGGRASLLVKATDDLSIRLTASRQKQSYSSEGLVEVNGSLVPNAETDASFQLVTGQPIARRRIPESADSSTNYYNAVIDYDFGRAALTSSTSWVEVENSFTTDATGLGLSFAGLAVINQANNHNKFNQEVRLSSTGDGRIKWLFGGFYSNERAFWPFLITSQDPANPSQPFLGLLYDSDQFPRYEEISGFGDVTMTLTDRFELSVGGRYTHNKQDFRGTFAASLFSGPVDFVTIQPTTTENKLTYSVAPRFKLNDDVSIYARVASGYRPGGPVPNFSPATVPGFPTQFASDTTTNYEIGAKGSLSDGRFDFDVAVYRIDWKDVQITTGYDINGVTFFAIGNGGTARSQGVEWSFGASPIDGLRLGWNGAYTDAELTEDALGLGATKGDRLPFVPKWSSNVSADYTGKLSEKLSFNMGASWEHVGERFATFITTPTFSNNPRIPSYDTVHLRAGLGFERYRLDLIARNITDSQGLTTYQSSTGFNNLNGQATIVQPRTVMVRLSANF